MNNSKCYPILNFAKTSPQNLCSEPKNEKNIARYQHICSYLTSLLNNLAGVQQSPKFHPEGDALYHSLQVFQCALRDTDNPILCAAALLHDVGKGIDYPDHANVGADELSGIVDSYICWLVRHHLDLLTSPQKTKVRLKGTSKLNDLECLRKWDLQGRKSDVEVMEIAQAFEILKPHFYVIFS